MLQAIQVALNTSDITGSLRLYSEAFGFVNAGGQHNWGEGMRLQGLGPKDRAAMWWMIGRQSFVQLEFFHHTSPVQRPQRDDWSPTDHGWVRFGIAVADFDACMRTLAAHDVLPISPPVARAGSRRMAFRDPFFGAIVEVIEDASLADGTGLPSLVYATSSVSDLAGARVYYEETLGFPISSLDKLHSPEDEALWGLAGAKRDGFIVESGGLVLEIVRYHDPVGRPRRSDWKISDRGILNIAVGTRDKEVLEAVFGRLEAAGYHPPYVLRLGEILAAYINDPEREVEFCAWPEAMDAVTGFTALQPFVGATPLEWSKGPEEP